MCLLQNVKQQKFDVKIATFLGNFEMNITEDENMSNSTHPANALSDILDEGKQLSVGITSGIKSPTHVPIDLTEESTSKLSVAAESALLLKDHIILLDPETDLQEMPISNANIYEDAGYTDDMKELDGEEEAFKQIQHAKDRAVEFINKAKEENEVFLNMFDVEATKTMEHTIQRSNDFSLLDSEVGGTSRERIVTQTELDSTKCSEEHKPETSKENTTDERFQQHNDSHRTVVVEENPEPLETSVKDRILQVNECSAPMLDDDESIFSSLPYEIIQKILSYLSQYDLCHQVALVNKKLKDYAYDPVHWSVLRLDSNKFRPLTSYALCHVIQRAPLLKQLYLCGQHIDNNDMLFIAESCPLLQLLDVGFMSSVEGTFPHIVSVISEHCHNLQYLNVEGCLEVNPECISMMCHEGHLQKLKGLNVSHCTKITDESLVEFARHKTQLELLNTDGISWITDRCEIKQLSF